MNTSNNENFRDSLSHVELFKDLTNDELEILSSIIRLEFFEANKVIIREGEAGDRFYIIRKGDVEVQKRTMYGDEYTCACLSGDLNCFFGEVSLLDNDVRSATIKSVTDIESLVIKRDDFMAFCENNMIIGYKIMKGIAKRLCTRLRKADSEILILFEALLAEIGGDK